MQKNRQLPTITTTTTTNRTFQIETFNGGALTIKPLQYGLSRALVLGAHQHNHSPRHDTANPMSMWKLNKYFTTLGWRILNGLRRRKTEIKVIIIIKIQLTQIK